MTGLTAGELKAFLDEAGIEALDVESELGAGLRFAAGAARSIVVRCGGEDEAKRALRAVFAARNGWLLVLRCARSAELCYVPAAPGEEAAWFAGAEREAMAERLARGAPEGYPSNNVCLVGGGGDPIVTCGGDWSDGVQIDVRKAAEAGPLLLALNDLGVEMEMCGAPAPRPSATADARRPRTARSAAIDAAHPLVGTWRDADAECGSTVQLTIEPAGGGFAVRAVETYDGETLEVSDVEWDGAALRFNCLTKSTGRGGFYELALEDAETVSLRVSFDETWTRVAD